MKRIDPYVSVLLDEIEEMHLVRIEVGSLEPMMQMRNFIVHTDGWPRVFVLTEECYQLDEYRTFLIEFRAGVRRVAGDLLL